MIKRIKIQGFGSLYDVDVQLSPLTLLLGPNASGKSSLMRSLTFLSKVLRSPLRGHHDEFKVDHATLDDLVSGRDDERSMRFEVWLDDVESRPSYVLEIAKITGLWSVIYEEIALRGLRYHSDDDFEFPTERRGMQVISTHGQAPRHATLPFLVYPYRWDRAAASKIHIALELPLAFGYSSAFRVSPDEIVTPTLPPWISVDRPYVSKTGAGFPQTLQRWMQTVEGGRVFEQEVLPRLRALFPHVTGVGFHANGSRLFIEYATDRARGPIPANLESDGVNLALFYHALPYLMGEDTESPASRSPLCLCLEEPETGTHPHFQEKRLDLLRHLTRPGATRRPLQIIASTHSVDLLRWVAEDEVIDVLRFVEHAGPERGTRVHQLTSQQQINQVLELWENDLGAAWYSNAFASGPENASTEPNELLTPLAGSAERSESAGE